MVRRLMLWLVVASVIALVAAPLAGMAGTAQVASAEEVVTSEDATPAADTGDETATVEPTETATPTEEPTDEPTEEPTDAPTEVPTDVPATPTAETPVATEEPVTLATTLDQVLVNPYSCFTDPEKVRVQNSGTEAIQIIAIRSVFDNVENVAYPVGMTLNAGSTRIFQSGPSAAGTLLTSDQLFNTTAADVRVRVETSVGTVEASCGDNPNAQVTLPSDIKITLNCTGNPEITRIDNLGDAGIIINSVSTLVDTTAEEPIVVNRPLGAGRTVIYRSGSGATSGTILSPNFLYTNTAYDSEGVVLDTSIGQIEQRCAPKPVVYPSLLEVTLSCATAPEWTKIINVGQGPVTLTGLTSLYQPTAAEPFSLNKTLQPGQGIIYRSGDGDGANFLTRNYIFNQDAGSAEGVRVTVSTGKTFTTRCPDAKKWIEVNLTEQRLYAWQGSTLVATSLVATGKDGFWTPTGTFYINSKPGTIDMQGCEGGECWYVPDVPASMAFTYVGHYIHGAYWHNNFGIVRSSHGCVNLPVDFAWWLFDWTPLWTEVRIHY
jgi:lipoprotein-anchoring transpeptidase ErfK/SrfK